MFYMYRTSIDGEKCKSNIYIEWRMAENIKVRM